MSMKEISLTPPEAALALSTMVSFADGEPSGEEAIILRRYYDVFTAENMVKKMESGGYNFPDDLKETEPFIISSLKASSLEFKLRTMAVALELAKADGHYDQEEMKVLQQYSEELSVELGMAKEYGEQYLKELDEKHDYSDLVSAKNLKTEKEISVELSRKEAGLALAMIMAFADDDPSEMEVDLVRKLYGLPVLESLTYKMKQAGADYPDDVPLLLDSVKACFTELKKEYIVEELKNAWEIANVDNDFDEREKALLEEFCLQFETGLHELKI